MISSVQTMRRLFATMPQARMGSVPRSSPAFFRVGDSKNITRSMRKASAKSIESAWMVACGTSSMSGKRWRT